MRVFLLTFLLSAPLSVLGQDLILSRETEISILTCGPGSELYTAFGHSAFRVKDPVNKLDLVFNYGTFDFESPYFYLEFARGKALYKLSADDFRYFQVEYQRENRWVKAQLLALDSANKQQVFDFLITNALPQNAGYLYDYFYDNCSSKIRDVLTTAIANQISFHDNHLMYKYTHRDLIRQYISDNTWGSLAIHVALGAVIDRKITSEECVFLPDYIFNSFENAIIETDDGVNPMVKKVVAILPGNNHLYRNAYVSPLAVFSVIGILVVWLTFKDYKNKARSQWLDFLLLFSTGLIGFVLLLLWMATNHTTAANNLNLLWAFAPNMIIAFVSLRMGPSVYLRGYGLMLFLLLVLLLIAWIVQIQVFSTALLPMVFFLGIRYFFLWRFGYRY